MVSTNSKIPSDIQPNSFHFKSPTIFPTHHTLSFKRIKDSCLIKIKQHAMFHEFLHISFLVETHPQGESSLAGSAQKEGTNRQESVLNSNYIPQ